jgi:hypothetical protein
MDPVAWWLLTTVSVLIKPPCLQVSIGEIAGNEGLWFAVKEPVEGTSQEELRREVQNCVQLGPHPNWVSFKGVVQEEECDADIKALIFGLCHRHTLHDYSCGAYVTTRVWLSVAHQVRPPP